MRKVLGILIVIAIVVVAFGFYRGWFALSSPSAAAGSNEVNVNLATDTGKLKDDVAIVKDKAAELTGSATDQPAKPGDGSADEVLPSGTSPDESSSQAVEPSDARRSSH
jgi:hypothetical protein